MCFVVTSKEDVLHFILGWHIGVSIIVYYVQEI